jgi:hypothetical protein
VRKRPRACPETAGESGAHSSSFAVAGDSACHGTAAHARTHTQWCSSTSAVFYSDRVSPWRTRLAAVFILYVIVQ